MTHARRGEVCGFCGRMTFGNGGKVSHARAHVKTGEAVELVKPASDGMRRVFISASDSEQIARLQAMGYVR